MCIKKQKSDEKEDVERREIKERHIKGENNRKSGIKRIGSKGKRK